MDVFHTRVQIRFTSFFFSSLLLRRSPLSDGPICRICHEGGSGEGLLSPCYCTGTLGTVHKSCLEKWLSSSNTSYCELCHMEFSIERRPRPLTEVTGGVIFVLSASVALERLNRSGLLEGNKGCSSKVLEIVWAFKVPQTFRHHRGGCLTSDPPALHLL